MLFMHNCLPVYASAIRRVPWQLEYGDSALNDTAQPLRQHFQICKLAARGSACLTIDREDTSSDGG